MCQRHLAELENPLILGGRTDFFFFPPHTTHRGSWGLLTKAFCSSFQSVGNQHTQYFALVVLSSCKLLLSKFHKERFYSCRTHFCLGHQHNWRQQGLCSQKMILKSSGIWLLNEMQDWLYSGCRTITWRICPEEMSLKLNDTWNYKVLSWAVALFPVLPIEKQ